MAEAAAAPVDPNSELLEWLKKDNHRFLHVVYRVGDLDRTIKFYTEGFGMKLLRKRDVPEEKYSNAFLGFGPEETNFVVELTYTLIQENYKIGKQLSIDGLCKGSTDYGVTSYDIGFGLATDDVYKMVEKLRSLGGIVTGEPAPVIGGTAIIAFLKDPDGYTFEVFERASTAEPLCDHVMLHVSDLDCSINFYEKHDLAMLGFADEFQNTILELTYNYGVTEYSKGNGYAQIAISTDDVYKSAEVINLVTQELGGKITRQPGPLPGINTKITSFLDPDGWKTVLVDNEDFLKEMIKKE